MVFTQEFYEKYANKKVTFGIAASDYPRLNITEGYATIFAEADLSVYVDNDGREELAFVLAMVRVSWDILYSLYILHIWGINFAEHDS